MNIGDEDNKMKKKDLKILKFKKFKELFLELNAQFKNKKYQDCVDIAEEILISDTNHLSALMSYGYSLFCLERYDKALNVYNRLLEEIKDLDSLWIWRGKIHSKMQNYKKAIPDFLKSLELGSTNHSIYDGLAWCFFKSENYEKAHKYADKAIALELTTEDMPKIREARMLKKAEFFERQNLKREALEQYKKVFSNYPNSGLAKKKVVEISEILATGKSGK